MAPLIRFVLPPTWPGVFVPVGRRLLLASELLGLNAEMAEVELSTRADLNIILGWPLLEPADLAHATYAIYQQEPLGLGKWAQRVEQTRDLFEGAAIVFDYSTVNLPAYGRGRAHWLPLRHLAALDAAHETRQPHDFEVDVVFIGHLSPRRQTLLRQLSAHASVVAREHLWGDEAVTAMRRAKIVLNIHQHQAETPLEQTRVVAGIDAGSLVVSETGIDQPYGELVQADFDDLVEVVRRLLANPSERDDRRRTAATEFRSAPSMSVALAEGLRAAGVDVRRCD